MANWASSLGAATSASIYALPPELRVKGAERAHQAGHWVHADVILKPDADGSVVNIGVDDAQVIECLSRTPAMNIDIHVMVLPGTEGWALAVDELAARLGQVPVRRWSASAEIQERLARTIPKTVETWVEIWPARDGTCPPPGCDGALVMLIAPGTKSAADRALLRVVSELAASCPVGVDGGVTQDVASEVTRAGASYLVIGRAMFDLVG